MAISPWTCLKRHTRKCGAAPQVLRRSLFNAPKRTPLQVSRRAHHDVRGDSAGVEPGGAEDLHDWAVCRQRRDPAVSHYLHLRRRVYGGVWIRCIASRDLAGHLRDGAALPDGDDRDCASRRAGLEQPAGVQSGLRISPAHPDGIADRVLGRAISPTPTPWPG